MVYQEVFLVCERDSVYRCVNMLFIKSAFLFKMLINLPFRQMLMNRNCDRWPLHLFSLTVTWREAIKTSCMCLHFSEVHRTEGALLNKTRHVLYTYSMYACELKWVDVNTRRRRWTEEPHFLTKEKPNWKHMCCTVQQFGMVGGGGGGYTLLLGMRV